MESDPVNITDNNPEELLNDTINETIVETDDNETIAEVKQTPVNAGGRPSIPQKIQPEILCNCPLRCDTKIGKEWRKVVYKQFQEIAEHATQNVYIQRHIKIKSIAKRLWEDEVVDKKIQRRVTCKYILPTGGSVMDSYSYARTLTYDTVKYSLDTNCNLDNFKTDSLKDSLNATKPTSNSILEDSKEIQTDHSLNGTLPTAPMEVNGLDSPLDCSKNSTLPTAPMEVNGHDSPLDCSANSPLPTGPMEVNGHDSPLDCSLTAPLPAAPVQVNGHDSPLDCSLTAPVQTAPMEVNGHDSALDSQKSDLSDVNSPLSFNDNDSVNTSPDDAHASDVETTIPKLVVKYIEVCQKAFMNMYGITEKRIRWQREKLILKSRIQAERKKKELEEIDRTLSLARNLGAGCQPLFALLQNSNCLHLSEQLMGAIEDDVALVNNFFHNQLWKPEDIMNKSIHVSALDLDSLDTECD